MWVNDVARTPPQKCGLVSVLKIPLCIHESTFLWVERKGGVHIIVPWVFFLHENFDSWSFNSLLGIILLFIYAGIYTNLFLLVLGGTIDTGIYTADLCSHLSPVEINWYIYQHRWNVIWYQVNLNVVLCFQFDSN